METDIAIMTSEIGYGGFRGNMRLILSAYNFLRGNNSRVGYLEDKENDRFELLNISIFNRDKDNIQST